MSRSDGRKMSATRKKPTPTRQAASSLPLVDRIKRGFLQLFVVAGVLCVCAGSVQGGRYLLALEVERIIVQGSAGHIATDQLEALIADRLSAGFLGADLDAIREQLEQLPWVYTASVRRQWPDTIKVILREQRPIARWGAAGFLNHEGEYFPGNGASFSAALPRLEGPDASQVRLMHRYLNLESMLTDIGVEVVRLSEDGVGQYQAQLDNGIQLLLGSDQFVSRTRRFIELWHQHLAANGAARVDLRYENGAAVQPLAPQLAQMTDLQERKL